MTGIDDTLAADLAALGNASVVPEDQGALVYARAFVQEVINDDAGDAPDPQWVYDRLVESLAVIENLTAALPFLTAAPSATRDEVARLIPVDALAALVTGHGGSFETGLWRVELAFPLSEPVSVDSWRQDLLDAITPKEDR